MSPRPSGPLSPYGGGSESDVRYLLERVSSVEVTPGLTQALYGPSSNVRREG